MTAASRATTPMNALPRAPDTLIDEGGWPRFGAYAGRVRDGSFRRLAAPFARHGLRRLAVEKRWVYACISSPSLVIGGAVVRLGYMANAFLYVFDRRERRLLFDRTRMLPLLVASVAEKAGGVRAAARGMKERILIEDLSYGGRIHASTPELHLDLRLDMNASPEPLTAICPIGTGALTETRKTTCVPATGRVRLGSSTYRLEDAFACLDYSHGYYRRETRWRWASACGPLPGGRMLGLNLVEGHNDGFVTENALWVDDRLFPASRVRFGFDARAPQRPWTVDSDDGRIKLRFEPEGLRSQHLDVKIMASEYSQPIGTWHGTVQTPEGEVIAVRDLPGVAENHRSLW